VLIGYICIERKAGRMKDRSFMLAKKRNVDSSSAEAAIGLRLDYRPPLRFSELLAFFRGRALAGVEVVDDASCARTARKSIPASRVSIALGHLRKKSPPSMTSQGRWARSASSARAVGGAVGHNPLCIIAPCHRVVGADGSLTGFGGGIDMKVKLLEHEGVDLSRFYRPKRGTAIDPASWGR